MSSSAIMAIIFLTRHHPDCSVEAFKQVGALTTLANTLNTAIPEPKAIAVLLGCCSSVLDNVALVAATMGMYPLAGAGAFIADSPF